MNISAAALPYRPCAGIVLMNADGCVFVGERIDTPGAWQMPQGGIDEGESIEEAAFRELMEETGTDKAEIVHILDEPIRYDLPEPLLKSLWGGQFRGQEQRWVYMRFTGTDGDINLNVHEPPEFSAWGWVEPEAVMERIVPFKREVYEKVLAVLATLDV